MEQEIAIKTRSALSYQSNIKDHNREKEWAWISDLIEHTRHKH